MTVTMVTVYPEVDNRSFDATTAPPHGPHAGIIVSSNMTWYNRDNTADAPQNPPIYVATVRFPSLEDILFRERCFRQYPVKPETGEIEGYIAACSYNLGDSTPHSRALLQAMA